MEYLMRFVSFEKLIAPVLIKILYWVGIVVIILGGLGSGFRAMGSNFFSGVGIIVIGVPIAIVLWRFYMEIFLVMFGIYDRLGEIKDQLKPPAA